MQGECSILGWGERFDSWDKFMAGGSQLVAAQSLLQGKGWLGGAP